MPELRYSTPSGIAVTRVVSKVNFKKGLKRLLRDLDSHRGVYLSSGYEFPGRYSRWDFASTRPPLEIVAIDREVEFRPLNQRGEMLNQMLLPVLARNPHWESVGPQGSSLLGRLSPLPKLFAEEERSKQPSAFSILRTLIEEFRHPEDSRLALIGAFCDDIYFMDRKKEQIERYQWDFEFEGNSTRGLERVGQVPDLPKPPKPAAGPTGVVSDHTPEEYMANVETVRAGMARG